MRLLNPIALLLVIVGALNWALVGLFKFDLVAEITGDSFGETNPVSRIVFVLVGVAGVYLALTVLPSMFANSTDRSRRERIAQTRTNDVLRPRSQERCRPQAFSRFPH